MSIVISPVTVTADVARKSAPYTPGWSWSAATGSASAAAPTKMSATKLARITSAGLSLTLEPLRNAMPATLRT